MQYKDHPIAQLLQLMPADELAAMAVDIKEKGQLFDIMLYENKILDGRNRYRACLIADVEPKFIQFTGDDPISFVASANLPRRHMTASQRAMFAADIAKLKQGGQHKLHAPKSVSACQSTSDEAATLPVQSTQSEAAKMAKVSERSVRDAVRVRDEGTPADVKQIKTGAVSVSAKVKEIEKRKDEFKQHFDDFGHEIPPAVWPDWIRADKVADELRSHLQAVKMVLQTGLTPDAKDIIFGELSQPDVSQVEALRFRVSHVKPYIICPTCKGHQRANCRLCKRRGWVSKILFQSPVVTKEERELWSTK